MSLAKLRPAFNNTVQRQIGSPFLFSRVNVVYNIILVLENYENER